MDAVVIGSGIVGSWISLRLAEAGLQVVVCDSAERSGDGISGRNSGVLHAGLYYPPGSQKAIHCIRGRILVAEFLDHAGVPYKVCGKLIVAADRSSEPELLALKENAEACGATGLEIVSRPGDQWHGVRGTLALHSRNTGVVDPTSYLRAVQAAAVAAGVIFLFKTRVTGGTTGKVSTNGEEIPCLFVVNAAGLHSDDVASSFGADGFEIRPNRGEYYRLKKPLPYQKLIYPLPHKESTALGVHYTFRLDGEAYAGPNSIWADSKSDYRITASRTEFFESLSSILDGYSEDDLEPGYAGLRPRLFEKGREIRDFKIVEKPDRVFHLLGIESPGLTSAPALAETLTAKILKR